MAKRGIDPDEFGMWECCQPGIMYTRFGRCTKCGKTDADARISKLPAAKPQRSAGAALEQTPTLKASLLGACRACRVVITRGYGSAGPLDRDNLLGSCKKLRDEIAAKVLGRDDDAESDTLQWEYRQEPGRGVKVEIFEA